MLADGSEVVCILVLIDFMDSTDHYRFPNSRSTASDRAIDFLEMVAGVIFDAFIFH